MKEITIDFGRIVHANPGPDPDDYENVNAFVFSNSASGKPDGGLYMRLMISSSIKYGPFSHYLEIPDGTFDGYDLNDVVSVEVEYKYGNNSTANRVVNLDGQGLEIDKIYKHTTVSLKNPDQDVGKAIYVKSFKVTFVLKSIECKVNIDGETKNVTKIYANIDGQLRKIIKIYYNINGELKEG